MLAEGVRGSGDVLLAGLMLDQRRELLAFGDQRSFRRVCREGGDLGGGRSGKFPHFGIFRRADDLSRLNGAAVIDRQIIEQLPGRLHVGRRRRGDRRGASEQQSEAQDEAAQHGRGVTLVRMIINSR